MCAHSKQTGINLYARARPIKTNRDQNLFVLAGLEGPDGKESGIDGMGGRFVTRKK